jgi:hypothetical protein
MFELRKTYKNRLCLITLPTALLSFSSDLFFLILPYTIMDISELVHSDAVVSESRPFQCTFHNCGKAFGNTF